MNVRFYDLDKMIVFAKKSDGKIVYIDDVENGYNCECFCLNCNGKLNAKNNGTKKEHHFAHASGSDCKKGHENTVPLFIQRILNKNKQMLLPSGNIKFDNKYINDCQNISIIKTELINIEGLPRVILITTPKGKEIALYSVLTDEDLLDRRIIYSRTFENLIEMDLRKYRDTDLEVEATLEHVLTHRGQCLSWKKRYDEDALKQKIKDLSVRKSFGNDTKYVEHFYCPLIKENTNSRAQNCNQCKYYLRNIIDGSSDLGCIGFIDGELSIEKIFKAIKPDYSNLLGPSFFELNAERHYNYYCFMLKDLSKAYPDKDYTLIYDDENNIVFFVNLKSFQEHYVGFEVDENGNIGTTPKNLMRFSKMRSWSVCSLRDCQIEQENIDALNKCIERISSGSMFFY